VLNNVYSSVGFLFSLVGTDIMSNFFWYNVS